MQMTAARRRKSSSRSATSKQRKQHYWSGRVTRESDALDLEKSVFKKHSPRAIAMSLKRSALASRRRKASPYQSAMSMLNFYINRAGRNLTSTQRQVLEKSKVELRRVFDRERKPAAK